MNAVFKKIEVIWFVLTEFMNIFLVNVPLLLQNIRKLLIFWCFQGIEIGNISQLLVTFSKNVKGYLRYKSFFTIK